MSQSPAFATPKLCARFWAKVDRSGDCWAWTAAINNVHGYGVFYVGGAFPPKNRGAHRVAYELLVGPIPEGMTIDHRCLNKICVNPSHLEVVTLGENGRRGNLEARVYPPPQTHCKRGHEFIGDNIYIDGRGERSCRACRLLRGRMGPARPRPLSESHGTYTGYVHHRCRCDECRAYASARNRHYKDALRARQAAA